VIRQTDSPQIRAIASETLTMMPIPALEALLNDSLYEEIAEIAISRRAYEFESDEARAAIERMTFDDADERGN